MAIRNIQVNKNQAFQPFNIPKAQSTPDLKGGNLGFSQTPINSPQTMGVTAKSPAQNIPQPTNTLPPSQQQTSYKGVPIVAGSDAQIQEQVDKINKQQSPATTQNATATPATPEQTPVPSASPTTPQATTAPQGGVFGQLIGGLARTAQGQQPVNPYIAQTAGNIQQLGQNIGQLRKQAAQAQGAYTTGALTAPIAMGRAQAIAQTEAQQEQGLGIQQQAQQGLLQNILAGQGLQQHGLQQAASLAQPQIAAYGQTVFNPITGQYIGGGQDMNSMIDYWATQIANNKATLNDVPATITGAPNLKTQLQQSIQQKNPNYNPTVQSSQQSTAGQMTNQVNNLQATANGAEANFDLLYNIAQQGGVNDMNVPMLNVLKQNVLRGLTSSDAVTSFQSIIQSVRSQYASIIGGGTVTVEGLNEAKSIIPDDISLAALQSLRENIKADAVNRIAGIQNQINSLTGTQNATRNTTGATPPGLF